MARGKAAGTYVERKILYKYRNEGWISFRSPASLGICDVIAIKSGRIKFIEVKSNVGGGPYKSFGPSKRKALLEASRQAGAEAILAYWPPNCTLREIPSKDWPD